MRPINTVAQLRYEKEGGERRGFYGISAIREIGEI